MSYQLNEKSIGQIIDGAFSLFKENFPTLIAIQFTFVGTPWALGIALFSFVADPVLVLAVLGVVMILYSVGVLIASAATVRVVSLSYLNREATFGDAVRYSLDRIGPLFTSGIAKWAIIVVGMMLFVFPGFIAALGYSTVTQVIVLEKPEKPLSALSRSWELTKGFKGRILVLGFVISMLVYVPLIVLGIVVALVPALAVALDAVTFLMGLLISALFFTAFTVNYYDLRVRKEAFDLEILGETLDD